MPSTGAIPESAAASGERRVYATALALSLLAAASTVWMSLGMAGGMAMPGGWEMSMAWMPMAGGWAGAAAMFLAMWLAMMVAMMLPSMLPMLLLYRRVLAFRGGHGLAARTWLAGTGYFAVWLGFGALAYAFGLALSQAAMRSDAMSRAVPVLAALALAAAGIWQLTPWKAACLRHCRDPIQDIARHLQHGRRGALALGLGHGAWCAACCWGLMLLQLTVGVMNLAAMAAVAAWIALEKLSPRGTLFARVGGVLALVAAGWVGWRLSV